MANEYYQNPGMGNEYAPPFQAPAPEPEQTPIQKLLANKKLLIAAAGGIVVLIIALIVIISLVKGPNKYSTPLDLEMAVKNAKTYKAYEKATLNQSNGLAESEMKKALKILKKSDEYDVDDMKDKFEDKVEDLKDEYGKNYEYYYEIEDKDKIDKDELKDTEDDFQDECRDMYKEIKDTDEDDIEELAEMLDIKESDAKKLIGIMEDYYKEMKDAKFTEGYELEVTYYVKGSELDEPEELYEYTINVYKVNGRWVSDEGLELDLF